MSHLAFIFPQFQDHPTKTERGAWFIVRRKDKCAQLWIGRQMIKGRNSNVLSLSGFINFSGGQAHDARGGTDGTKWSEVRRNIFSKTKSSRRNISQKKTFNPRWGRARGQKVTFSVNGLLLWVIENPLTDGCYDKGLQVKYTLIRVVLGRGLSLGGNVQ